MPLRDSLARAVDFEMLALVELSIFCFRYIPPEIKAAYAAANPDARKAMDQTLDGLNERILTAMQREGNSYLSNARLNGHFALRGCVLNFRTTKADMEILVNDIRQAGQHLS